MMSNANERVPLTKDSEPHVQPKTYDRAPVTPTMHNGPQDKGISQLRYNYRWQITFLALDDSKITPRKKFATFLSMIGQFWPST
eukprot:2061407-Ditylum_brightwellii.AAC.1